MSSFATLGQFVTTLFQRATLALIAGAAIFMAVTTGLSAFGYLPWAEVALNYGGAPVPDAGMMGQIALTVLLIGLCFYIPSSLRVLRLEESHRNFQISMEDVRHAYILSHAEDRKGVFNLKSEFDSVRERLIHMRKHPDLASLEPGLMEAAAQMSHLSHELADVYSDEKVNRAHDFLVQRQEEIDKFNRRLDKAKVLADEMTEWVHEVEIEESVAAAHLERLREQLREIMPELGTEDIVPVRKSVKTITAADATELDNTVVDLPKAAE